MPRPTLKIVASQRDALYEQVRNHLAGLGDVVVARFSMGPGRTRTFDRRIMSRTGSRL